MVEYTFLFSVTRLPVSHIFHYAVVQGNTEKKYHNMKSNLLAFNGIGA